MTSIATSFDSIAQLVQIIKALKPLGKTVNYQKIDSFRNELGIVDPDSLLNELTKKLMDEENTDLVKFIFDDMEYDTFPVPTLAAVAALHVMDPYRTTTTQVDNFKLLLSIIISRKISISDTLADKSDDLFTYYMNVPIPEIVDLVLLNLGDFRLKDLQDFNLFKGIVQRISRDKFFNKVAYYDDEDEWMKAYDKAAKDRAVEVSLGLGYAQMDNQVQSTIPSIVLQEIVNQSTDLSGMPAWQVYQIVKHINEGTTAKTVRLGQPSNFADAKDEDGSFISTGFEEFMKNPAKFQITDDDLEKLEEGDITWYEMENSIDWQFVDPNGNTCVLQGYFNGHEIMIEEFSTTPEKKGIGRKCLQYIKSKIQPLDYSVNTMTAIDEAAGFWEKMEDEGLLNY